MSGLAAGRARVRAMLRKCFRMQRMVTSLNATAMATAAEAFDALFPRYGIAVKRRQHLWGLEWVQRLPLPTTLICVRVIVLIASRLGLTWVYVWVSPAVRCRCTAAATTGGMICSCIRVKKPSGNPAARQVLVLSCDSRCQGRSYAEAYIALVACMLCITLCIDCVRNVQRLSRRLAPALPTPTC